jgi:hypothetical protein
MVIVWTKDHPVSPSSPPSDYYWFKAEDQKYEEIIEVYPNRRYFPKGWWGPKIPFVKKRAPKKG